MTFDTDCNTQRAGSRIRSGTGFTRFRPVFSNRTGERSHLAGMGPALDERRRTGPVEFLVSCGVNPLDHDIALDKLNFADLEELAPDLLASKHQDGREIQLYSIGKHYLAVDPGANRIIDCFKAGTDEISTQPALGRAESAPEAPLIASSAALDEPDEKRPCLVIVPKWPGGTMSFKVGRAIKELPDADLHLIQFEPERIFRVVTSRPNVNLVEGIESRGLSCPGGILLIKL